MNNREKEKSDDKEHSMNDTNYSQSNTIDSINHKLGRKPDDVWDKHPSSLTQPSNHNDLEDKWNSIKNEYLSLYKTITYEDVEYRTGEFELMIDNIAKRMGKSRSQIKKEIENWNQ